MIDHNTMELNKHLKDQEDYSMAVDQFDVEMEEYVDTLDKEYNKLSDPMLPEYKKDAIYKTLQETVDEMKTIAKSYCGYDLSDEVDELISEHTNSEF